MARGLLPVPASDSARIRNEQPHDEKLGTDPISCTSEMGSVPNFSSCGCSLRIRAESLAGTGKSPRAIQRGGHAVVSFVTGVLVHRFASSLHWNLSCPAFRERLRVVDGEFV